MKKTALLTAIGLAGGLAQAHSLDFAADKYSHPP